MTFLDFLIYNLTAYLEKHRRRRVYSSPLERSTWFVGIITMLWAIIGGLIFSLVTHKTILTDLEVLITLVCAILIAIIAWSICSYIYIKKGRYRRIAESSNKPFNLTGNIGFTISFGFYILSCLLLAGLAVLVFW